MYYITKAQAKKLTISELNEIMFQEAKEKDISSYRKAYNRFCHVNVVFIKNPSMETNDKLVAVINELIDEFVKIVNQ